MLAANEEEGANSQAVALLATGIMQRRRTDATAYDVVHTALNAWPWCAAGRPPEPPHHPREEEREGLGPPERIAAPRTLTPHSLVQNKKQ